MFSFSKPSLATEAWLEIQSVSPYDNKFGLKIDRDELAEALVKKMSNTNLKKGQYLSLPFHDVTIGLRLTYIESDSPADTCKLNDDSKIVFMGMGPGLENVLLTGGGLPVTFTLDFKSRGIGGLKKELEELVRKAFLSRALGKKLLKVLDMKHTKGVLLYGPPGTGKTLIAREIANMFMGKVKIINGPELKDGLVGQSVKNLENVFSDARYDWALYGEDSPLHVIIIDEIDALCPVRGSRKGTTGVDDDMVSRLLTLLDGVDSPQNILVIGMTNRKDMLDPALLRPGRMEVHIEIKLPEEQDRYEILCIKTDKLKANGILDNSVDLKYWAAQTKNYTGAEIEQLVKSAREFAAKTIFNFSTDALAVKKNIKNEQQLKNLITQKHFERAFADIVPAFGVDINNFKFNKGQFVIYNQELADTIAEYKTALNILKKNMMANQLQFLISGERGVGKATLARYLADSSGASAIRVISPERLLGLGLNQQMELMEQEFRIAERAELGVIILDEIEDLLHADAKLRTYENELRLKLSSLLKNMANSANKCVVIATTKSKNFMAELGLLHYFKETKELNNITLKSLYAKESCETLASIAASLGYATVPSKMPAQQDQREINFSISDLAYQITRFCSDDRRNNILDIDMFYASLQNQKEKTPLRSAVSSRNSARFLR